MHDQENVHTNYIARLVPQYGNVQRIILAWGGGGGAWPPLISPYIELNILEKLDI